MIIEQVQVEKEDKQEALEEAYQKLQAIIDQEFSKEDISLQHIEEKKKLWGLLGANQVYQAEVKLRESSDVDGSFQVLVRDDGIFLQVFQPQGDGVAVELAQVRRILNEKEIVDVDYEAVTETLSLDGEKVKIAERKPELDRDAEIDIEISDDKLTAHLNYFPPLGGKELTAQDIIAQVKEAGIVFGIKEEEFKSQFNPEEELKSFIIAKGKEATAGKDGRVDLKFDLNRQEKNVNLREDGKADFYNLNRIINVAPEEILAEKIPAEPGEPGRTVTGEEISPEPVEEADLSAGENVEVSQNGKLLKSIIEGQVVYNNGEISVSQVHEINDDLDLSTGNVDFNGSVIIKGDIKDGMVVEAGGNVEVGGSVYNAKIDAGGQVVIKKGFVGGNQSMIQAQGDIQAKFVENGQIETEEKLEVRDAIMHSNVDALNEVIVEQGKGLIVGGKVRAGKEIRANRIGSNLGTETEIIVGVTPRLRDEYNMTEESFKKKTDELDRIIKDINQLKKMKNRLGDLPAKKQQLLNELIKQRFSLSEELEDLEKQKKELSAQLEENNEARIKVKDRVHPGVKITIGEQSRKIDKEEQNMQYYLDEEDIKTGSYS
ncbi:FapA family protein [Halanaerocella petrolearia]